LFEDGIGRDWRVPECAVLVALDGEALVDLAVELIDHLLRDLRGG
jgi:hypothetical protein